MRLSPPRLRFTVPWLPLGESPGSLNSAQELRWFEHLPEVGAAALGRRRHLLPRQGQNPPASDDKVRRTLLVRIEMLASAVELPALALGRDALGRPREVESVALTTCDDPELSHGQRKSRALQQLPHACF